MTAEIGSLHEIGYRKLKSMLQGSVSGQAQQNSYTWASAEREDRLRRNLDKLETMQKAQNEQPPQI